MSGLRQCNARAWQTARRTLSSTRQIHSLSRRPQIQILRSRQPQIASSQQRFKSRTSAFENAKKLFRDHPFHATLVSGIIFFGFCGILYVNYYYQTYIIGAFHNFPEPVAVKLRRAIYFHNYGDEPDKALKYYQEALQVADELGVDPFGDEIMGVKLQVAKLMEDINKLGKCIEVLEIVRRDNLKWMDQLGDLPRNKSKRTKVLTKTIAISVKLGELYADPAIYNREMAEERFAWAVQAALKERQRRINENVTEEEEGPFLTNEEIGATLESLAHNYEAQDMHYLSAPLFLQALHMCPAQDCHSVILMNNLATSLSQQSLRAAREAQAYATSRNIDERPVGPVATRETMIEMAKAWAVKAIDVAAAIKTPDRNQECDDGCAVAMHNLGEFAEMSGDIALAKTKYKEAVSFARSIGHDEAVQMSSARLNELAKAG